MKLIDFAETVNFMGRNFNGNTPVVFKPSNDVECQNFKIKIEGGKIIIEPIKP